MIFLGCALFCMEMLAHAALRVISLVHTTILPLTALSLPFSLSCSEWEHCLSYREAPGIHLSGRYAEGCNGGDYYYHNCELQMH